MLDVYELCTPDLQEKMASYRSKFKDLEDKKVNQQPKNVSLLAISLLVWLSKLNIWNLGTSKD